jgi:biotin synthase
VNKVYDGEYPNPAEIGLLLNVEPHSLDPGFIISSADNLNHLASDNQAEVHAQIGINCAPCPRNCSFCAFAAKNKVFEDSIEISIEDAVLMARNAEAEGANALFIMATGDYPFKKFIEISKEIRSKILPETFKSANISDFNYNKGKELKEIGYTGIYHAVRMGEGKVTNITPETRLKTVRSARESGLLIGTCVEPIGPEHDVNEIVEKIIIGREMEPCYSGAMRRINIPGSEMEKYGMLTEYQTAFIVAVVRLSMGRNAIANYTHEPNIMRAAAGTNLF